MTGEPVSRETLRAGFDLETVLVNVSSPKRDELRAYVAGLLDALAEAERERERYKQAAIKASNDHWAAEAVVERQREALAEAIRFLEDVAPPNDTTRNRISAALACLREVGAMTEAQLAESERNLDLVRGGYEQVLADNAQLEQRITSALAAYEERTFQWETEGARAEAAKAVVERQREALHERNRTLEEWLQFGHVPGGGYDGTLIARTKFLAAAVFGGESAEPREGGDEVGFDQ